MTDLERNENLLRRAFDRAQARDRQGPASLLVQEAQRFASLLNPPRRHIDITDPPPPPPSVPKFALMGTSHCVQTDMSFAFVRLPDNAWQWVRRGERVDRGVIQEIGNGSITYWDGRRNVNMIVERVPGAATLLEGSSLQ